MNQNKITEAVNIMIQTDRMHKHLLDSRVSGIGLHRTAHRILMHISRCDRLFSQKCLADHLGITPAAITGILKRLEKDGYISRAQGTDNRFNEIELTELGRQVVEASALIFSDIDKSLFEGFSDEELEVYIACLKKIQNNINRNSKFSEEVK